MNQPRLRIVPVTAAVADRFVARVHRHHAPARPYLVHFCVGVVDDIGLLRGAAVAGRPSNRNSDDGHTAEVLRVATDGCPNACSALYGACLRVARAMGFARVITYTLEEEGGASLRGAGWKREADGIQSWWSAPTCSSSHGHRAVPRREHYDSRKVRWAVDLKSAEPWHEPVPKAEPWQQEAML